VFLDQMVIVMNRPTTIEKIRMHERRPNDPPIKSKRRGGKNFRVTCGKKGWMIPRVIEGRFTVEELYE